MIPYKHPFLKEGFGVPRGPTPRGIVGPILKGGIGPVRGGVITPPHFFHLPTIIPPRIISPPRLPQPVRIPRITIPPHRIPPRVITPPRVVIPPHRTITIPPRIVIPPHKSPPKKIISKPPSTPSDSGLIGAGLGALASVIAYLI